MNSVRYGLLCGILLILAQGCTLEQRGTTSLTIGDGGFFSQDPCGPPCFWGIVPGSTEEKEVIRILKSRGIWETCESFNNEAESGVRGITCARVLGVHFKRGGTIVAGIGFSPSSEITVHDVLGRFGEPDYILLTDMGLPEYPETGMSLYYERITTKIDLPAQDNFVYSVSPFTKIESIGYFDVDEYEAHKTCIFPYLLTWHGYGEYEQP